MPAEIITTAINRYYELKTTNIYWISFHLTQ